MSELSPHNGDIPSSIAGIADTANLPNGLALGTKIEARRQGYQKGRSHHEPKTSRDWVLLLIERAQNISPEELEQPMIEYGVSATAVSLAALRLRESLGFDLAGTDIDYPLQHD